MKKYLGYGVIYLIGLLCIIGLIYRADSLDKKMVDTVNNTYAINYQSR